MLGRECARRALAELGVPPAPILFDEEGAPNWPVDVVGSISHKREKCVAVVARSSQFWGLGVDLERDVEEPAEDEIIRRVCATPMELAQARALRTRFHSPGTLFLAVKEAYFKLQFPLTRLRIDWDDVEVTFGTDTFVARQVAVGSLQAVPGVFVVEAGWLFALAVRAK